MARDRGCPAGRLNAPLTGMPKACRRLGSDPSGLQRHDQVVSNQSDLVESVAEVTQVLYMKG